MRMRERTNRKVGPPDALESAETGQTVSVANGPRGEIAQATFKKIPRRRKASQSTILCLGSRSRARIRRFMLRWGKHPRTALLVIFVSTPLLVSLGAWISFAVKFSSPSMTGKRSLTKLTPLRQTPKVVTLQKSSLSDDGQNNAAMGLHPEYGGLDITFFKDSTTLRTIKVDTMQNVTEFRNPNAEADDDVEAYYFFDDDVLRGQDTAYDLAGNHNKNKKCRFTAEHRYHFPNCNSFHELDRIDPMVGFRYLNYGAYREVFSFVHFHAGTPEHVAIKDLRYDLDVGYENFEFVRMDAIVAERLTASPRIYDIYGFCGIGIMSEYFFHDSIEEDVFGGDDGYMRPQELHDENEVKPQNNLTGIQKLVLSLEMAEALADLHGYANGLIVHDDVQLSQYLFSKDKTRLKLNDFNRAEFPLFDEEHNEYCTYTNGHGGGNWRAPEEYKDLPLTEQIDVWSFGNNMYTLLTGLNPLYHITKDSKFIQKIISGKTAYIDPRYKDRSFAEGKLAELIARCFKYQPEERPSIFEAVAFLRDAVKQTLDPGVTREQVLKSVRTAV